MDAFAEPLDRFKMAVIALTVQRVKAMFEDEPWRPQSAVTGSHI
jgi:hypothetical protein